MVAITGQEANLLLYLFDATYRVDNQGKVDKLMTNFSVGFPSGHPVQRPSQFELQALRDKLFNGHEHPEEGS